MRRFWFDQEKKCQRSPGQQRRHQMAQQDKRRVRRLARVLDLFGREVA